MELNEVMRTTFAARDFTDDEVSDEVLGQILNNARFAPSGGNRQGWHVVVVRDRATREAFVPLIEPTWRRYLAQHGAGETPWNTIVASRVTEDELEKFSFAADSLKWVVEAPVVLTVFVDLAVVASFDAALDRVGVVSGASVYPFIWNILLSARNEGLGGTVTTFVAPEEASLQALLGVPRHMAFAAMIPIGRPVKQLTKLKRKAVSEFTTLERYDGARLKEPL